MCGIFGIINKAPKKFDYQTFCTLGICNDERGGDSCGVFIDGKYEYGVDKQKLFSDFYQVSEVIQNTEKAQIALGHCRKASVGVINEKTAQPVVITENNVPVFVVVHNGTIFNYEQLAKKWIPDVDIKDMTDSQVMARIFYECGYDVLGEYNGGSAFIIVDYRSGEPVTMAFKGHSLATSASVIATEERPLFVVFDKDTVIFSSIGKFLKCGKKGRELFTVPANTLVKIKEDMKLEAVKEYDRSELYQFRQYTSYANYEDWNDDAYYNRRLYGSGHYWKSGGKDTKNTGSTSLLITNGAVGSKSAGCKNGTLINSKIVSNEDGTYCVDGVLAHGFYRITRDGDIIPTKSDNKDSFIFFFWQGIMLFNKECYKFLKKLASGYKITEGVLIEDYPLLVHSLSPDPFRDNQLFKDGATYIALTNDEYQVFANDQWQYFMSNKCYWFDQDGLCACDWDVDKYQRESTFDDYKRLSESFIDFSYLIDEYKIY